MRPKSILFTFMFLFALLSASNAFTPLPVADDPLVRMPGSQPDQGIVLQNPRDCMNCHGEDPTVPGPDGPITVAPGFTWSGSMMAQAGRDPIFWACMAVAGQDSVWALGNPNAVDICERCHFPAGWLGGRSDPPNASRIGKPALSFEDDFDGVHCEACHRMWDPFFELTFAGSREGSDWEGYWDEFGNRGIYSNTDSQRAAAFTREEDRTLSLDIKFFSQGELIPRNFFSNYLPYYGDYNENGAGQYFVSTDNGFAKKRASFADTRESDHTVLYSRYHKSKYFCSTCHDVSNPALANACETLNASFPSLECLPDRSGGKDLITEQYAAHRYFHVERTFSEFILSGYGKQGGAATNPEFRTATGISSAAKCQDCHLPDVVGKGCEETGALLRPDESTEHPKSGAPLHDMQGGNLWITHILGSLDDDYPATFDETNHNLLVPADISNLTLDMEAGITPTDNGDALLAASTRAGNQLTWAATIKNAVYNPINGSLTFRIQNNTGHKLISGFPEGRRMFVNIKAFDSLDNLIYEINPYDYGKGTLKGFPSADPVGANESYVDALVYEVHPKSDLTGENETFHFVLATGRYKDNRIPPKGFDIANAATRLIDPVDHGVSAPNYFTEAEYAGGYDDVSLRNILPKGAAKVEIRLYYQGTSREYVEFLRDEINGTATTLSRSTPFKREGDPGAYIVQTDPFFEGLKGWGNTIWNLWHHNHGLDGSGASVPGIVPFEMTSATAAEGNTVLSPMYLLLIL